MESEEVQEELGAIFDELIVRVGSLQLQTPDAARNLGSTEEPEFAGFMSRPIDRLDSIWREAQTYCGMTVVYAVENAIHAVTHAIFLCEVIQLQAFTGCGVAGIVVLWNDVSINVINQNSNSLWMVFWQVNLSFLAFLELTTEGGRKELAAIAQELLVDIELFASWANENLDDIAFENPILSECRLEGEVVAYSWVRA